MSIEVFDEDQALGDAAECAARLIGATERAHVDADRGLLRRKAAARRRFDCRGTSKRPESFSRTGIALEDLAVAAYKAAALRLRSKACLPRRSSATRSRRHAAWMRRAFGVVPPRDAFDQPERPA